MRKSVVFISALLTTFALVLLYNVASAYRESSQSVTETAVPPTAAPSPTETDEPIPTSTVLMPEEAAQLAAQVVGNSALLSAESANINGVDAYKITFTNNDVVYIGLDGQVLSVQVAPVVVNAVVPAQDKKHNNGGGSNRNHERHDDDHAEHEDHDD